jgi:hypothetical protein
MRFSATRLVLGVVSAALVTTGTAAATPIETAADCPIPPTRDIEVTKVVHQVGKRFAVSPKVMLAGFETGWVESHMNNLPCGDRDSLGVFQQRPSANWGTPDQIKNVDYAATQFFTRAVNVDRANPGFSAGQISQTVQISAFPDRYDAAEGTARQLMAEVATTSGRGDRIGDVSGDGYADLLAVKPNGTLYYYANNINTNTGHKPFTDGKYIGEGFGAFRLLRSGDVSGDGHADMIGVQGDGSLHYFPNNINGDANGWPYSSGINIGGGFEEFTDIVLGDISGDGYADLLAVKSDGTLVYFPNNINTSPDHRPYGDRHDVGGGFNAFTQLRTGDVSGDGYADLIGVMPNGTLLYFPNNINSGPCCQPFGLNYDIGQGFNVFSDIVAGDVSGDGYADLIGVKSDGTLHYFANNINGNANGKPYTASDLIGSGFNVYSEIV